MLIIHFSIDIELIHELFNKTALLLKENSIHLAKAMKIFKQCSNPCVSNQNGAFFGTSIGDSLSYAVSDKSHIDEWI